MLMVTRENRPPLAFGVIGCHIVAGRPRRRRIWFSRIQNSTPSWRPSNVRPSRHMNLISFLLPIALYLLFSSSVSGARLLGLASASEVSLETALRQFRVIGGALVPVQLFAVLASP